jgi:hypothetical protein
VTNKIADPNDFPSLNRVFEAADDGIRTHTRITPERILSPLRLPFRHIGAARPEFNLVLQPAKMNFAA